ncbi:MULTISPECIES: class I SAM-dependent methyltransferase [Streptosporangium]|uniref:SAM-dependent methyltransferase n=1 Tax=Streptosporangium brasiliense TaxID=47480 RepID=A0ABT9R6X2_9ACTN|nr:methyltransferase domain-containing protein [Streptosporangium brasiliense]MDP9865002.1 SAM-dependent methyltransferase [Streptosporangium brasiliense]
MSEVRSVVTRDDMFSRRIREQWTGQSGRRLDVLIAGCGWPEPLELELDQMEARVIGIDEDLPALRASTSARKDLDSWALGDLRSVPVPPRSFDIVHVSFLLERIEHPELVLDRLLTGLRPGGLLLLQMRDRASAYGACDRLLPAALRRTLWHRFAPSGTVGPLPPFYGQITSREGMHSFCLTRGLMVTDDTSATSGPALRGPLGKLARAACSAMETFSRGRWPASHDEIIMVIRKPHSHFARLI